MRPGPVKPPSLVLGSEHTVHGWGGGPWKEVAGSSQPETPLPTAYQWRGWVPATWVCFFSVKRSGHSALPPEGLLLPAQPCRLLQPGNWALGTARALLR